jgi:hypothetical protein
MFRRFQTYLIIAATLLLGSMFFSNMCYSVIPTDAPSETWERITISFFERSQFLIMAFVTFSLCVIALFHNKKRMIQIRICLLNSIILFAFQIWILVEFMQLRPLYSLAVPSLFPLIAIILLVLAIRYIAKDETVAMFSSAIRRDGTNNKKGKKK